MNNNRKGRGRGLKKEVGAYIYFLPLKKEGLLERLELGGGGGGLVFEGGRLIEDLQ